MSSITGVQEKAEPNPKRRRKSGENGSADDPATSPQADDQTGETKDEIMSALQQLHVPALLQSMVAVVVVVATRVKRAGRFTCG